METSRTGDFAMAYFPADQGIGGAVVQGPGCLPNETGTFDPNEIHSYITEGIGEDIIPLNYDFSLIDYIEKVTDKDAAIMQRRLAKEEGIFAGNSAGSAIQGVLQIHEKFPFTKDD